MFLQSSLLVQARLWCLWSFWISHFDSWWSNQLSLWVCQALTLSWCAMVSPKVRDPASFLCPWPQHWELGISWQDVKPAVWTYGCTLFNQHLVSDFLCCVGHEGSIARFQWWVGGGQCVCIVPQRSPPNIFLWCSNLLVARSPSGSHQWHSMSWLQGSQGLSQRAQNGALMGLNSESEAAEGRVERGKGKCQGHSHPKLSVVLGVGGRLSADKRQPTTCPTMGNTPVWFPGH